MIFQFELEAGDKTSAGAGAIRDNLRRLLLMHSYADQSLAFIAADVFARVVIDFQLAFILAANIGGEVEKRLFEIKVVDRILAGSHFLTNRPFRYDIFMPLFPNERFVTHIAL